MVTSITNRLHTFLLVLIAVMAAAIIAILANRATAGPLDPPGPPGSTAGVREPGTPITSIPYTISGPGYYYLTGNLSIAAPADGITINAQNVTLDLKGFTLTGQAKSWSGVVSYGAGDVIRNGHLSNWNNGIQSSDAELADLTTLGNVTGMTLFNTTVNGCLTAQNSVGIDASNSVVRDCYVEENSSAGASLHDRNDFEDNHLWANGNLGAQYDIEVHGANNMVRDNSTALSAFHEDFLGIFPGATNTVVIRNYWTCSNGIVNNGSNTFSPGPGAEDTNYCW